MDLKTVFTEVNQIRIPTSAVPAALINTVLDTAARTRVLRTAAFGCRAGILVVADRSAAGATIACQRRHNSAIVA